MSNNNKKRATLKQSKILFKKAKKDEDSDATSTTSENTYESNAEETG